MPIQPNAPQSATASLFSPFKKAVASAQPSAFEDDAMKVPVCCPVPPCGVMVTCILCGDVYHSSCLEEKVANEDEFRCTNCRT